MIELALLSLIVIAGIASAATIFGSAREALLTWKRLSAELGQVSDQKVRARKAVAYTASRGFSATARSAALPQQHWRAAA